MLHSFGDGKAFFPGIIKDLICNAIFKSRSHNVINFHQSDVLSIFVFKEQLSPSVWCNVFGRKNKGTRYFPLSVVTKALESGPEKFIHLINKLIYVAFSYACISMNFDGFCLC